MRYLIALCFYAVFSINNAQAVTVKYSFVAPELQLIPNPEFPRLDPTPFPSFNYSFQINTEFIPEGRSISSIVAETGSFDGVNILFDDGSTQSCATFDCFFNDPSISNLLDVGQFNPFGDFFFFDVDFDANSVISSFVVSGGDFGLSFGINYTDVESSVFFLGRNFEGPAGQWTTIAPVPLPTSVLFLLSGLLALGIARRRGIDSIRM